MQDSYADTLESYIIAEEGFKDTLKTTGKVMGGIAGTAIAAPFILVSGVLLSGSIRQKMKNKKLLKTIKNNNGNYDYYHDNIYKIISMHSHDIIGILEPVNKDAFLTIYSKLIPICNEMKNIRTQFCKISISDIEDYNYTAVYNKISALLKKATDIVEEIRNIDISSLNNTPVKLNESLLSKLDTIGEKISTIIDPGNVERNDSSRIMTDDYYKKIYYDSDGDYYNTDRKYKIKNKLWQNCIRDYDKLYDIFCERPILYLTDSYINKCKFAINPNTKLK